jgi:Fe2+ or Zn2+ uptake regulation protein
MSDDFPNLGQEWLAALQASGYHLTTPLRVLVGILTTTGRAMSPAELYDLGRLAYPRMGLVTVYRSLSKLETLGMVQRVHQENGCHMVVRTPRGHEHLLLCTSCGQARYFAGDDLTELMNAIALRTNFEIHDHWLQFFGLCQPCRDAETASFESGQDARPEREKSQ